MQIQYKLQHKLYKYTVKQDQCMCRYLVMIKNKLLTLLFAVFYLCVEVTAPLIVADLLKNVCWTDETLAQNLGAQ